MRRAFADTLFRLAHEDEKVIFLTGDLGFKVFDDFQREFPERYLNVGVAEAHLVDCAAGLALEGWKPIVYSIASFMTGRAFEQIRLSLGYHDLPVVVVGAGGGYIYATSGVSHHAKEDMALMNLIPNMKVVNPGDPTEMLELLPQLINGGGPSYLRLGKFGEQKVESIAPIELGKGRIIKKGSQVAFITIGTVLVQAVEAAEHLALEGINPSVCHFHTLNPLDKDLLVNIINNYESIIVVEDHGLLGGLRNAISLLIVEKGLQVRLVGIGPDDSLILGNPTQDEIKRRFGMDSEALANTCRALWNK